ncbi:MAG: selenium-dependent molybdenum cofactor biosynthesis protein YqeB [Anaerolineales bacterium]
MNQRLPRILLRGTNDVASAAARRLFCAGYPVFLHETPLPTALRRKMAFTDAVFDGQAVLDGVWARLVTDRPEEEAAAEYIPVSLADFAALLKALRPQILIDARMRKHAQPETQRGLTPLVIGLGPNFIAGQTVDAAIETGWGDALGAVLWKGATNPLSGEPREVGGHARDRYIYAPLAGLFQTSKEIGAQVHQGEEVARIDSTPLFAPMHGILRGLTHSNVPVAVKTKVVEIDPRLEDAQVAGVAERPARIAEGVLQAVQTWRDSSPRAAQNDKGRRGSE